MDRRNARSKEISDPYERFADLYDAWQGGYPKPFAAAAFPFFEREIVRRGFPDRSLVDLGCGTGGFLLGWAARHPGWRLAGVDRSSAMLRVAERKLSSRRVRAALHHQTLQTFSLPAPVGIGVCVFDGVNHLTRTLDLRRFFRAACRSLLPDGLLLFDLNEERAFHRLFSGTWAIEGEGLFASVSATCREDRSRGRADFTIFRQEKDCWHRCDLSIIERNWTRCQIERAIASLPLRLLRVRRFDPYPKESIDAPRTLWVLRRIGAKASKRPPRQPQR